MAIRIITDSASDIQPLRDDLTVLPMTVAFGNTQYRDGIDITNERFYEMLIESDELPKTGAVTPYEFEQALEAAAAAGEEAIVITLSSKLSVTHQNAHLAAEEAGVAARIVDSENVCIGQRILVEHALWLVDEGFPADEVVARLEGAKGRIRLVALLDTLEYLRKGGRVGALAAGVGAMLSIKPVIAIKDGAVAVVGKARGSKNGRNLLSEIVDQTGGIDYRMPFALAYSGLSDKLLMKYVEDSRSLWEGMVDGLPIYTVGATIGTHAGPGAVAVAFFSKE